jgi:serine/threonine-protein kinase
VGEATQLLEFESRIAETVAELLGVPLLRTERDWMRDHPTDCLGAYDLYLRGNQFLAAAGSPDFALAIDFFERAVESDPDFAQAHAKLSIAHTSMYWFGHDRTQDRLARAKAAADRAMSLRSELPLSHLAQGWYYYWGKRDFDRALRHFEVARATWPGITDALVLIGGIRRRQGDWDHGLTLLADAARSNPACWVCDVEAANTHILRRDFDAARRAMSRARALVPSVEYPRRVAAFLELADGGDVAAARRLLTPATNFVDILFATPSRWTRLARVIGGDLDSLLLGLDVSELRDPAGYHLARAELAGRSGDPALAAAHYESARALLVELCALRPEDPDIYSALAIAYAGLGLRDEALHEAAMALQLRPVSMDAVDGPLGLESLARVHTMLGDYDTAIDTLEGLLAMPSTISATMLRLDPVWAPLESRPEFQALLR